LTVGLDDLRGLFQPMIHSVMAVSDNWKKENIDV